MINTAYNLFLHYSFDKLKTIASIYYLKASFNLSHTTQTVQFLRNDQALSNKQL